MSSFPPISCPRSGGQFVLAQLPADAPLQWNDNDGAEIALPPTSGAVGIVVGSPFCPRLGAATCSNGYNQAILTVPSYPSAATVKVCIRVNGFPHPVTVNVT
jgi:hypothetical protein